MLPRMEPQLLGSKHACGAGSTCDDMNHKIKPNIVSCATGRQCQAGLLAHLLKLIRLLRLWRALCGACVLKDCRGSTVRCPLEACTVRTLSALPAGSGGVAADECR